MVSRGMVPGIVRRAGRAMRITRPPHICLVHGTECDRHPAAARGDRTSSEILSGDEWDRFCVFCLACIPTGRHSIALATRNRHRGGHAHNRVRAEGVLRAILSCGGIRRQRWGRICAGTRGASGRCGGRCDHCMPGLFSEHLDIFQVQLEQSSPKVLRIIRSL